MSHSSFMEVYLFLLANLRVRVGKEFNLYWQLCQGIIPVNASHDGIIEAWTMQNLGPTIVSCQECDLVDVVLNVGWLAIKDGGGGDLTVCGINVQPVCRIWQLGVSAENRNKYVVVSANDMPLI